MKILKKFENEKYELFLEDEIIIIKDKIKKTYHEVTRECVNSIEWVNRPLVVNNIFFYVYIYILLILSCGNIYICFFSRNIPLTLKFNKFSLVIIVYYGINIILHELTHIFFLKLFNRNFDKVGFKLNYIFPSFYVKMNDVYMLERNEKIIVHSGGLMINLIINTITFITFYKMNLGYMNSICKLFSFGIFYNTLPILDSDGYKTMITLLKLNKKKKFNGNNFLIKVLHIFNILIATFYVINFIVKNIKFI